MTAWLIGSRYVGSLASPIAKRLTSSIIWRHCRRLSATRVAEEELRSVLSRLGYYKGRRWLRPTRNPHFSSYVGRCPLPRAGGKSADRLEHPL